MATTIKDAALDYIESDRECNLYAAHHKLTLMVGNTAVDVETIWHNKQEDKVYLHCGCKEFEGDIDIESLSDKNQDRLREVLMCASLSPQEVKNLTEQWKDEPLVFLFKSERNYSECHTTVTMRHRLPEVTEPEEVELYSIEPDGEGGKQIHISAMTWASDNDGDDYWRLTEGTFVIVPLQEFIDNLAANPDYVGDLWADTKQYEGDLTEQEAVETINHYFNGKTAHARLAYSDITIDTPFGDYIC